MKKLLAALIAVTLSVPTLAATPRLHITTKHHSPREEAMKAAIERLAAKYDLKKYTLTRDIIIEQGVIAHSYPVLTLNAAFLNDDDLALSQYVHEQAHWVISRGRRPDPRHIRPLLADLKRVVPNLPTTYPDGGYDERGTYVHLAVNLLEWQAMEELVGAERARRVIEWKQKDHYKAIYAAVLEHRAELEHVLKAHQISF